MASDGPSIVCAVDSSASSAELVRIAADLADLVDAELDVVHVLGAQVSSAIAASTAIAVGSSATLDEGLGNTADEEELQARAMLDDLCVTADADSARRHVVRYGDPARRVAAIAEERGALIIVVGAREDRREGDALIGSVSSRLAADAPCPVLVIPPRLARHVRPRGWRRRTLVSGFDGSVPSWCAARHAAALADLIDGSLHVVTVGTAVRRADVLHGLHGVYHEHRAGDPSWELERVAAAITAPLIAVGSRGLGPWEDALLGTVARRLLQTARRPILVLPAASVLDQEMA